MGREIKIYPTLRVYRTEKDKEELIADQKMFSQEPDYLENSFESIDLETMETTRKKNIDKHETMNENIEYVLLDFCECDGDFLRFDINSNDLVGSFLESVRQFYNFHAPCDEYKNITIHDLGKIVNNMKIDSHRERIGYTQRDIDCLEILKKDLLEYIISIKNKMEEYTYGRDYSVYFKFKIT